MELRLMRYFVAVAEELHFGRAAARLHMAQPPLSQQIRLLEAGLGVELLRRTTRKVELTAAGVAYLDRVRSVLWEVEDAAREVRRVAAGTEGRLVVGCVGSATYSLLPALARRLREELPRVDFSFRGEMLAPAQVEALVARNIDLALLRPPVDSSEIELRTLRHDKLIVALPEGHRLSGRKRIKVSDLRDEDFIMHAGQGRSVMSGVVASLCQDAGFVPRVRQEVAETSTMVTFVAAGLGVAIVPEPVSALGVPGATFRPLTPRSAIELCMATRAGERAPHVARAAEVLTQMTGGALEP